MANDTTLEAVIRLRDEMTRELSSIQREMQNLNRTASNIDDSIGDLQDAMDDAGNSIDLLGDTTQDTNAILRDTNSAAQQASNALDGMALQEAGRQMQEYGEKILGVVANLTEFAAATETNMAKVNSILGLGDKEFEAYTKDLKEGANELGMTYADYADAAYSAISASVAPENVTDFLAQAYDLAKGGLTDLEKSTDLLTTIQNAYGMTQEDMAHVSDVLIQTQNKGKITVDEMASAMGKVIPTAKNAGVSIEQLGASYAMMTSKGIKSAEATTFLNSMFKELNTTGSNVDKAIRQVSGKSFQELMQNGTTTGEALQMLSEYAEKSGKKLSDLFGSGEAGTAALTLLSNGVEGYNEQLKNMENSTGLCADAAETMGNTTASAWTEAKNRLDNAKASMGEALLPVLTDLANAISPIIEAITSWTEEHPELTKVIILTVAAIGAFLVIGGAIITLLGTVVIAMGAVAEAGGIMAVVIGALTSPITIVIGAIAALIAIGITLTSNWDTICAKASELAQWISNKWNEIKNNISTTVQAIKDTLYEKWEAIKTTVSDAVEIVKSTITNAFNEAKEKVTGVIGDIQSAWEGFKSLFTEPISAVVNFSKNLSGAADGNHAAGLQRVPYDGYIANLHQGEAVLTRREADKWRSSKESTSQVVITMNGTIIREEADIKKVASALVREINQQRIIVG